MAKQHGERLAGYRAKRDFKSTPEPAGASGRAKQAKPEGRRFCVQKHLARSLHYDLRLEHDGVLLSWAIPKGPSLNPRDKRFAARTEDHPIEYGDFEGVIPEGYGAGIMMLWDQGTWTPENCDVAAALEKGELKFALDGVKLKGSWVLVRTKESAGGAEQWLLIKHNDQWSGDVDVTTFAPLSVKTFGDFADILRTSGIPAPWRKRLPVKSGETAAMLRSIISAAGNGETSEDGLLPFSMPPVLRLGANRPKLTNLDKPLYPTGFTKGDLIEYYRKVAPLILPHLAGRAVTLLRYPDGVEGKSFFQKRCPAHRPPWVRTVRVDGESADPIDYCVVEDLATLLWVANLAAIELHVPLALAATPDTPTAMVFDLDPGPPAGLAECFAVGRRIRDLLAEMKLKCFAKLSGKKGLHILVPLNVPDVTFEATKRFAKAVAQTLARDDPKRITAVMRKDERAGKVFIDWNQNDRAKTMVCAYSLRAGPRPAASWPTDLQRPPGGGIPLVGQRVPADDLAGVLSLRQRLP